MVRRTRGKIDVFAHSDDAFDFEPLLDALARCRCEVLVFQRACGVRNPAFSDARALVEQIEALALLTRVPHARQKVVGEQSM